MHEYLFSKFGMFIYTIPSAMILMIGREWYLYSVISKMGIFADVHYTRNTRNPFLSFDLWGFLVLIFGGYSWGGLIKNEKRDTIVSFVFAQLWFIVIIVIAAVFLHAKGLSRNSYIFIFLIEIIKMSWIIHLINYIPLPPFDASFFYTQKSGMNMIVLVSKLIATALIIFFPVYNDFLSGQSLIKLLGLY
ncbi:MAG: hypothetical protein OEV78_03550 [Spirochaetia bacterium]|nr:hypothetical protein [Spirochaetia bacterium]